MYLKNIYFNILKVKKYLFKGLGLLLKKFADCEFKFCFQIYVDFLFCYIKLFLNTFQKLANIFS